MKGEKLYIDLFVSLKREDYVILLLHSRTPFHMEDGSM